MCAGHVSLPPVAVTHVNRTIQWRALWVLTEVLNELCCSRHANSIETSEILPLIRQHVSSSRKFPNRLILERGTATIPLIGIDVPFHSTFLRDGIDPYRKFLEGKILEQNIDPDKLIGKFIPNVTGKPFSVDKSYVKEVAEITGSATLREILENVSSSSIYFVHQRLY